jgi:hypothetical protein
MQLVQRPLQKLLRHKMSNVLTGGTNVEVQGLSVNFYLNKQDRIRLVETLRKSNEIVETLLENGTYEGVNYHFSSHQEKWDAVRKAKRLFVLEKEDIKTFPPLNMEIKSETRDKSEASCLIRIKSQAEVMSSGR